MLGSSSFSHLLISFLG